MPLDPYQIGQFTDYLFDYSRGFSRHVAGFQNGADAVRESKLFCNDLVIDKEKLAVYYQQEEIIVSQPEYHLLLLLMENKGKTITRKQLLEEIWDSNGNYVNDNTLTVTMKRLREKLHNPPCLKTVRSFGYRMEDTI